MVNKPIIVPLVCPDVDWTLFITMIANATGRSPSRLLDLEGKKIGTTSSYLDALAYFSQKKGFTLLNQCSYSFLIEVSFEEYVAILSQTDLDCVDNFGTADSVKMIVASGTVLHWRNACMNFCIETMELRIRYTFNCIYIYMSNLNLIHLNKTMLVDRSFTLEEG